MSGPPAAPASPATCTGPATPRTSPTTMLWSPPSCTAVVRHSIAASAASRTGAPVSGPGWCGIISSCRWSGRPRLASQRAMFSDPSSRMETAQNPVSRTAS